MKAVYGNWTACEDQQPNDYGCYLVTWEDSRKLGPFYEILEFDPENGWDNIPQAVGKCKVIAWMELPELYEEEEE